MTSAELALLVTACAVVGTALAVHAVLGVRRRTREIERHLFRLLADRRERERFAANRSTVADAARTATGAVRLGTTVTGALPPGPVEPD